MSTSSPFRLYSAAECMKAVPDSTGVELMGLAGCIAKHVGVLQSQFGGRVERAVDQPEALLFGHMGFVPGLGTCVKSGMQVNDNARLGLDRVQASVTLFSAQTGEPRAVLDGGVVTVLRTAGALIAGVRSVLTIEAPVVAVIGYGAQGRQVARLASSVLGASEVRIWAPSRPSVDDGEVLAESKAAALQGADVVACCTSSRSPVIELWELEASAAGESTIVASINSFAPDHSEIASDIVAASRLVITDIDDVDSFGPVHGAGGLAGNPQYLRLGADVLGAYTEDFGRMPGLKTVLIGGEGTQDALMAWAIVDGEAAVIEAVSGLAGDRAGAD
ncbi:hypothetical protein [Brevibacterium moorei]|uniref:hypothetical protein n=1 Tax=Brevibacterium moorei TaxID=2968457 RepID=UPI00211C7F9C|nr:hypothetical protein [Brevibacterium sp. 68QC2CO]MCQ9386158.1 hypothetical protein [Brevibacterium sp. 68QC2CO]